MPWCKGAPAEVQASASPEFPGSRTVDTSISLIQLSELCLERLGICLVVLARRFDVPRTQIDGAHGEQMKRHCYMLKQSR